MVSAIVNTSSSRRTKRSRRGPLDATSLRDLALSYVSRYSTTGAKLEAYLARKLRERGVLEDPDGRAVELDVAALVEHFTEQGYVNDDAYARAKARDLETRGYGPRRVEQALWAAGVDERIRNDHMPSEGNQRRAAATLAKKRRFGPFGREDLLGAEAAKLREKQMAAMLRAGHSLEIARFILHSESVDDVELWVIEAEGEDHGNQGNGIW